MAMRKQSRMLSNGVPNTGYLFQIGSETHRAESHAGANVQWKQKESYSTIDYQRFVFVEAAASFIRTERKKPQNCRDAGRRDKFARAKEMLSGSGGGHRDRGHRSD